VLAGLDPRNQTRWGFRLSAHRRGSNVRLITRNGRIEELPIRSRVIDAEPYSSPPRTRRQYQIELTAERLSGAVPLPRLRAMTRMLAQRYWKLIRRVARALLAEETLSGRELDRLIGRSVNGVKPNHVGWFLKVMAAKAHA
jgi:hypothetical protein